ncbi:unnamed protein product [Phaedon cochleariae]|uniref:C2H2-type domain-containing protein n=1 Tax=Phaedon cochleariae TaxID=80249 RepID=A0A9N9X2K8_PHACE|nr:unnamed protein product [Phaedon cochleariae]
MNIFPAQSSDKLVFKIWNSTRHKKTIVTMRESEENLLLRLITKASEKLKILGTELVLESDGTKIDEDEVLKLIKYEILILLQPGEEWKKPKYDPPNSTKPNSEQDTYDTIDESFGYAQNNMDLGSKEPNTGHRHNEEDSSNCLCKFKIPWEEIFSRNILMACEQGNRDKRLITIIIHGVVNKMRESKSCFASQSQASKMVTKQIISRFPLTFRELDENDFLEFDQILIPPTIKKLLDKSRMKKEQKELVEKAQDNRIRPGYSPDSQFACRHCGKRYKWKSTMRRHEQDECGDQEPKFQCPYCPYKAKQKGNLRVHVRKHHSPLNPEEFKTDINQNVQI